MSAEALASRVSSQVPSPDLITRFAAATEAARIAVEDASTSYKELVRPACSGASHLPRKL